jgi:hypothetical protein
MALLIALTPSCGDVDDECPTDARAGRKFTFRLINRSASPVQISLGCGANPAIELDTPNGALRIGPESAQVCAATCERVRGGVNPSHCTDCGGGHGIIVPPELSTEIEWDRRVWVPAKLQPSCSGLPTEADCALGVAVDMKLVTGRLMLCADKSSCLPSQNPTFVADLSLDAVNIEFP